MPYEFNITGKRYHTLDYYLKLHYRSKVFKVPLNASFTCPNRDGSKGIGGCSFCSNKGSGDFAGDSNLPLMKQYYQVRKTLLFKWPNAKYIAYFQAFTNTYAPLEKLKEVYEPFKNVADIMGMSIGTRPDCLSDEIIDYLADLRNYFDEFWVELGLQTANDKIADSINRCYHYETFAEVVRKLAAKKIKVVVHIINGLPHETKASMIRTIKCLNKLPIFGIKIHCLNVIANTKLADDYLKGKFRVLSEEEFIDIAIEQIKHLKGSIIIHRIGGDSNAADLIAPHWVLKKLNVVDKIDKKMNEEDTFQGDKFL